MPAEAAGVAVDSLDTVVGAEVLDSVGHTIRWMIP